MIKFYMSASIYGALLYSVPVEDLDPLYCLRFVNWMLHGNYARARTDITSG